MNKSSVSLLQAVGANLGLISAALESSLQSFEGGVQAPLMNSGW